MIDVSTLRSPGWQQIVAELSAIAPDDRAFLDRLLRIICQVSAARQAVCFVPSAGEKGEMVVQPLAMWPAGGADGEGVNVSRRNDPETVIQWYKETRQAAYAAIESAQSRVFGLEKPSALYGAPAEGGYVLALPLPGEKGASAGAITLQIEHRSKAAVQSTMAMAEVLIGYVHGHALRQELRRTQQAGASLDLATRLIGAVNAATNFKGVLIQVANDLAKQFKADRVAIGWVKNDATRVLAISDTEYFDRRMAMIERLEAAMNECLDQDQPVLFPAPSADQDAVLGRAITHAHRELAVNAAASGGSGDGKVSVCSLPLREGETIEGVVTFEVRGPGSIDPRAVEQMQAALDLLAPVLSVRRSDDRNLALRAWDSTVEAGAWLVGVKHTVWKMVAILVIAAMVFVTFYKIDYRVGANAELRPRAKRIISAPFEGMLASVPKGIEPGATVKKGDVLAEMDTNELRLQAADAQAKVNQADKALAEAMKSGKTTDAGKAKAQGDAAKAELALYESRIARARIVAPIDGTILAGDLKDKAGAAVKLGDELYQLAALSDIIVVAKVDERDVALINAGEGPTHAGATHGWIATKSLPDRQYPVAVELIVPMAVAGEGQNTFEVRMALDDKAPWMRPGMEGIVRLNTGPRSLLYIGTRRVVDVIRLWLW